ncbi:MAG TPA: hypothetical protein VGR29_06835 [Thermomicrobiales bacterium]|nr:hypothetical protein [Thermomicrobiales bacterium]
MRPVLPSLVLVVAVLVATVPHPAFAHLDATVGRLAFASSLGQPDAFGFDLYTVATDGTDLTRLTRFGEEGMLAQHPTWSPDGNRIAFGARDLSRAGLGIHLMDADGANLLQLTDAGDCNHFDFFAFHGPDWSPDGNHIAFAADLNRSCGEPDLYLADASGEDIAQLTSLAEQGHSSWMPDWAPDGTRLVFVSGPGGGIGDCYVVSASGGEPMRFGEPGCQFPAWSPDGTMIATISRDGLCLVPVDEGKRTCPMSPTGGMPSGMLWNHAWSPDGTKILFEMLEMPEGGVGESPPSAVYVLDVATGKLTRIDTHVAFAVAPVWSADGSHIAFVARLDDQPGTDLYIAAPDGGDLVRVTTVGDDGAFVADPAWDPAG